MNQTKAISITVFCLGIAISLFCLFYLNNPKMAWGAGLGAVLAVSNYVFLTKIVVKILNKDYKGTSAIFGLFLTKIAVIVVTFFLAFWLVKVDVIGFVLGFGALIPVLIFAGLTTKGAYAGHR